MLQGNPLISNITPAKTHEEHRDEPLSSAEHSTPLSLGEGLGVRLLERGWGLRLFFLPLPEQFEAELAAEDAVAPSVAGEETYGEHSGREAVAHLDIGMDMMSLKR